MLDELLEVLESPQNHTTQTVYDKLTEIIDYHLDNDTIHERYEFTRSSISVVGEAVDRAVNEVEDIMFNLSRDLVAYSDFNVAKIKSGETISHPNKLGLRAI